MSSTKPARPADLLTEGEAAGLLTVSPRTLQDWRTRGDGPPVTRIGRLVRYRRSALVAWLASNTEQHDGSVAR